MNEFGAIMSTPKLVEQFYTRIWNAGDLSAVSDLLAADFAFRGSLGTELSGHNAFKEYVRSVRDSLSEYQCEILTCVAEGERAFVPLPVFPVHRQPGRLVLVEHVRGDVVALRHFPAEAPPHLVVRGRVRASIRAGPCGARCHPEPPGV